MKNRPDNRARQMARKGSVASLARWRYPRDTLRPTSGAGLATGDLSVLEHLQQLHPLALSDEQSLPIGKHHRAALKHHQLRTGRAP